ncbi:MAG TPA: hypothetical protein VK851_01060, partial [Anaerolineales bacterium]|nr:hypothetical protein [Anaerolineales bacterium]
MNNYKKRYNNKLTIFILLAVIMTACNSTPTAVTEPTPVVTPLIAPTSPACINFTSAPTPGPESPSLFPPITNADHIRGPQDATVTILVYGDLQNRTSGLFSGVMNRLLEEHPDDLRFVSRIFPLV